MSKLTTEEMIYIVEADGVLNLDSPLNWKEKIIADRLREADAIQGKLLEAAHHLRENLSIMKETKERILFLEAENKRLRERWEKLKIRLEMPHQEKFEEARFTLRTVLTGVLGDMAELEQEK